MQNKIQVGIDIGGTFTDIFVKDDSSNSWIVHKVPSTPPHFSDGFMFGLTETLELAKKSIEDISRIIHGTTLATNSIITQSGAKIGFLLTEGCSDILQIGYGWRPKMYDLDMDPVEPLFLAPRRRCLGVKERLDYQGKVITKLNTNDLKKKAEYLVKKEGCEVFVVCYLHSYANPIHEKKTKDILNSLYPNIPVTISSEVLPKRREYKRMVVSGFDGYVKPLVTEYLLNLESNFTTRSKDFVFHVMQSHGGVSGIKNICQKPVGTALSGLAAGVIGAANVGKEAGYPDCISLDMGGTSTDVALIKKGKALITSEGSFGDYPLTIPMIDVRTIGAGGSSIAYVDGGGALKVGPESAGANPGPACYSNGGKLPTVTDASFVLGYLNKDTFAGGLDIDIKKSKKCITDRICKPLKIDLIEAALGIHEIVNSNMAQTLRLVSVKQGHDPREFTLMPFGGAGPIHSGKLAEISSIKRMLIPPTPGVLSALGLMLAPIQHEAMNSYEVKERDVKSGEIKKIFKNLDDICLAKMKEDGVTAKEVKREYYAEMRYSGQAHEIEIPIPTSIDRNAVKYAVKLFHKTHLSNFSYNDLNAQTEFVTLRSVHKKQPNDKSLIKKSNTKQAHAPKKNFRKVCLSKKEGFKRIPVFSRGDLLPGFKLKGPAIIEQSDTTTLIQRGHNLEVDVFKNLIITLPKNKN